MADNELYSAYHWAKKAERAAASADTANCLKKDLDGVYTVEGDNHPLVIKGMAGTTATGLQIVDSLGAGETDLEHYATGDRYGSRLVNRTSLGAEGFIDLYTTSARVTVLDLKGCDSVLTSTPSTTDGSERAANTAWVRVWLDKLWDDIDAGLLGDDAKTGDFYTTYTKVQ